ncbi:hypothetical protein D3C75_947220 [compost metagenome]
MNVYLHQNHINSGILLAGIQLHLDRTLWFNLNRHIRTKGSNQRTSQCLTKRDTLRLVMQLLQCGLDHFCRL